MKRTPLKRTKKLVAKKKIKPKRRTEEDYERIYGSRKRVAWVQSQPCIACNRTPSENAHIRSGGMGRKADYRDIVPLCRSCHTLQHSKGWKALGFNASRLQYAAFLTQYHWAEQRED